MLDTLIGGVLGAITRTVPEVMTFFDKKNERAHELAMADKSIQADTARASSELAQIQIQTQSAQFTGALAALQEAVKGQAQITGKPWIDAINMLVRPGVTYILFSMWTIVKLASLVVLIQLHPDLSSLARSLQLWWLPDDQTMLAAILNFWFMGRVFDKALR